MQPTNQIYRVGDLHLGHKLVAATRGFFDEHGQPDIAAHDKAVLQSIRDTVPAGSTLVLYGDNSNNTEWMHALYWLRALRQELDLRLELVIGNHDIIHPMHAYNATARRMFDEVFKRIDERRVERLWGRKLYSSHFPVEHGEDDRHSVRRDDVWRWPENLLLNDKNWFVHAHTHQQTLVEPERQNHVCVSWDVRRRPISDAELKQVVLQQMSKHRLTSVASWGELEPYRELAGRWARREVPSPAAPKRAS